ncbi:MAG: hypothetical protein IJD11_01400, partial [Oscillospiraceae bacterium]|nr:hypothetical protein [Oscillospiraceae bacterium]
VIGSFLTTQTQTASAATSPFYFKNTMSEQTLKNYLSRAVTFQGLCGEGNEQNMLIDEDIRMIQRTGAKFISRAALFAWNSTAPEHVKNHYAYAEKMAKKVHDADPEIILQAFVAEIVRKSYVDKIEIPAWVFEAFGKTPEKRNFKFEDIIDKTKGANHWGNNAGYPDWSREEAQMWYYYCIIRYIDIGYESIHIQDGEDAREYGFVYTVLNKCREYAKTHARRGIVLFHNFFSMTNGGGKIGNKLIFDIHGNGLVPNETVAEDGVLKCRIGTPSDFWCTWFGRSNGGEHPLGFTVKVCPTILEFDNYGPLENPGKSNGPEFGTWGYDDITWFATQPESYRNEFLLYLDEYMKTHELTNGKQNYFPMYPMRRVITPSPNFPEAKYMPGENFNDEIFFAYTESDDKLSADTSNFPFKLTTRKYYRANRQSDGCPNGFNQEDTIRKIFLGADAKENPEFLKVVLPSGFSEEEDYTIPPAGATSSAAANTSSKKNNQTANSKPSGNTDKPITGTSELTSSTADTSTEETASEETASEETTSAEETTSDFSTDGNGADNGWVIWLIVGIVAVLLIGGGAVTFIVLKNKKK